MIDRYTKPEMAKIWSDENRFKIWLKIEIAACEAWNRLGEIPQNVLEIIKQKADFNIQEIRQFEETNQHEMIAFLESVQNRVGPESRYIHYGLTSSDVMDTALAVQLKESGELILKELNQLTEIVKEKAIQYQGVPCVARTHGVHAEPTTFGLKLLVWLAELERNRTRMEQAVREISVGKISGAVGTYANLHPDVESYVCEKLGLKSEPASTQIVQRDRHAFFLSSIALLGASLEKMGMEVRNLQRTEIGEVEEPFGKGQKGSSAMPHKKNPVLSERICGLARLLRGYALTGYENVALWHERDISHSSVERVSLTDSCILIHYMLVMFEKIVQGMRVYPERMKENLERNGGIVYSGRLLLKLVEKGMLRQEAYELVQSLALKSVEERENFFKLIQNSREIQEKIKPDELKEIFNPSWFIRHEKKIYSRF
jgi:adenylosuccinate lyase